MSIFNKISDRLHYFIDNFYTPGIDTKIEHFLFDYEKKHFIVIYRIGKKKLLNKMDFGEFERMFFEKVSIYDQHRLTKFSTFQKIINELFYNDSCKKDSFINYVMEEAKNEQLF